MTRIDARLNLATVTTLLGLALAAGCAESPTTSSPAQAASHRATAPAPAERTIVQLVGRDRVITVTSGPTGPRYTARTRAGELIVAGATLDELRASRPDVYRELTGAASVDSSPTHPTLIADLGD